jgi:hypothetical protein
MAFFRIRAELEIPDSIQLQTVVGTVERMAEDQEPQQSG